MHVYVCVCLCVYVCVCVCVCASFHAAPEGQRTTSGVCFLFPPRSFYKWMLCGQWWISPCLICPVLYCKLWQQHYHPQLQKVFFAITPHGTMWEDRENMWDTEHVRLHTYNWKSPRPQWPVSVPPWSRNYRCMWRCPACYVDASTLTSHDCAVSSLTHWAIPQAKPAIFISLSIQTVQTWSS